MDTGDPNFAENHSWPRYEAGSPTDGLSTFSEADFSAAHQCAFWDGIFVY